MVKHLLIVAVAAAALVMTVLFRGGKAAILDVDPVQCAGPGLGVADLSGRIIAGPGAQVLQEMNSGLPGVVVCLYSAVSGEICATSLTDINGEFQFNDLPSDAKLLLKVWFTASPDLDQDGDQDQVNLIVPIKLASAAEATFQQAISAVDSDGDGRLDAVEVQNDFSDNLGHRSTEHTRLPSMDLGGKE
jgi:hypothetical protein